MSQANHSTTIHMDCETVVARLTSQLTSSGLRIVRSFDLNSARSSYTDLHCPHHGKSFCDCQLVVLLVYGEMAVPASVILHCHQGMTQIEVIESPNTHPDNYVVDLILQATGTIDQSSKVLGKHDDNSN